MKKSGKKKRTGIAGGLELVAVIIIIGVVAYLVMNKTTRLRATDNDYITKIEILERQIEDEEARTEVLQEQKKYVKTDQYIEEVARDKLGLINPNEVLFKENE